MRRQLHHGRQSVISVQQSHKRRTTLLFKRPACSTRCRRGHSPSWHQEGFTQPRCTCRSPAPNRSGTAEDRSCGRRRRSANYEPLMQRLSVSQTLSPRSVFPDHSETNFERWKPSVTNWRRICESRSRGVTCLPFCRAQWIAGTSWSMKWRISASIRTCVRRTSRKRLAALLETVRLIPEDDNLVAEVGLQSLEIQSPARDRAMQIRVVAGAGFGTLPVVFNLAA